MKNTALLACNNPYLAASVRDLMRAEMRFKTIEICSLKDVLCTARANRPDVIIVFNGLSYFAHFAELAQLRTEQPKAKIILTAALKNEAYGQHPDLLQFDALLDEAHLLHDLIPAVTRLLPGESREIAS